MQFYLLFPTVKTAALYIVSIKSYSRYKTDCPVTYGPPCIDNNYSNSYYHNNELLETTLLYSIKVPLIKGQLAAGVLMLVSAIIFIIIFAVTTYRVQKAIGYQNELPVQTIIVPPQAQHTSSFANYTYGTNAIQPIVDPPAEAHSTATAPGNQVTCQNCKTSFQVSIPHH